MSQRNAYANADGVDGVTGPDLEKQETPGNVPDEEQPMTCQGQTHHHRDKEKKHEGMDTDRGRPDGRPSGDGQDGATADGKVELTEHACYDKLGFSFPWWKKWGIIAVIFIVQTSMNFNAGFYASGISLFAEHFGISEQAARVGQMDFLVAYGIGSEFWAPWSEEYGRWPVMQLSLFLVNIWQLPCALAPNFGSVVVARILGGLSCAGGSVTLGMVADMWEPEVQQWAVAFVVLSSVGGSVVAPIVGGFATEFLDWHWNFWLQLIFGGFVQAVHFWIPETRVSILITREARKRRRRGEMVYSGDELKGKRITMKHLLMVWARPYIMFVREPIVLWLSLLSGFSDSLIFTFLASYALVYEQWGFGTIAVGLSFIPWVKRASCVSPC